MKDEIVAATFLVSFYSSPPREGQIQLHLNYEDADHLLVQLTRAVIEARNHRHS